MSEERGTITLWILGLCLALLLVGGIALDLWRAFSARRALAAAVDAAAAAGASAIDERAWRDEGAVRLVPSVARERARTSLRDQPDVPGVRGVDVYADTASVHVVVRGEVGLTLLSLAGPDEVEVTVRATARPVRAP